MARYKVDNVRIAGILMLVAVGLSALTCGGCGHSFRTCIWVTDGDTIMLDGQERVRLIGVDTPELHHPRQPVERFAREASLFTRRLVEGQRVRLEFDQQRQDRYGRTLAYVYLRNGTLVNLEIIRQGYGFAYTKYPFRGDYMEQFRRAEREARDSHRGLWVEEEEPDTALVHR